MADSKSQDDLQYLGEEIVSFRAALLRPTSEQGVQDWAFGLKLALKSRQTRRLKMFRPHLAELSGELRRTLMSIPNVDERSLIRHVLENGSATDRTALKAHPLMVYHGGIPDPSDLINKSGKDEYVKLITADIHSDIIKFDITFLDNKTERFSMASCVAVILSEVCEQNLASMHSRAKE